MTFAALIPMRIYRMLHTMGNTMGGGESIGFTILVLYASIPARDSHPDSAPTARHSPIQSA